MVVGGDSIRLVLCAGVLQQRKLLMGLEAPEALGGLLRGGARPAQGHRTPVFHVAAAFVLPQRCALRRRPRSWRSPQAASASCSIISASASSPAARQNRSKLAHMLAGASVLIAF